MLRSYRVTFQFMKPNGESIQDVQIYFTWGEHDLAEQMVIHKDAMAARGFVFLTEEIVLLRNY